MSQIKMKITALGFTLVELLVVIAVVSMLLFILTPALRAAKESGQSVVCMSNVRRIAIAGNLYTNEHMFFPPFRLSTRGPNDSTIYINQYGREQPRWQWFFDQGIGPVIDPSRYLTETKTSFNDKDTMIMTNKNFFCPSFRHDEFNANDIRNGSYGYNYQYLGNSNVIDGKYVNFPVKACNIVRPCQTIIIGDSRGAGIPHGVHSYTLDPPKIAKSTGFPYFAFYRSGAAIQQSPAEARHDNRANVSYIDGHAESKTLTELGYVLNEENNVIPDDPSGSNSLWSGKGALDRCVKE